MDELGKALIDDVRKRLAGYPAMVRAALEVLDDAQIWARPHASANSVGNLVLHLCGSTRHFLGRGVGGSDYRRDRPAEFAEKGPLPRAELLRAIEDTVAEADRVLAGVEPGLLLEVKDVAGETHTVLALLLRTAHHWGVHAGQIVYAAKALKEAPFDELWRKTMR
jgi:uncharacterized damage-inducible protein DinB